MRATEIIARKRANQPLSEDQIRFFIEGYTTGTIPDYQAAALLMAISIFGLTPVELSVLTDAMLRSGKVLDLSHVEGMKVDKHSTGGVGDKISICLAPAVAFLGIKVPMISGRGLGHTGGTLDKLEAIRGFDVHLSSERFIRQVADLGVCLIGQTEDLAPADRKLYALRDVTATVDSIPLIASSIMSKKLVEGIDALVLDVKVGKGAFMESQEEARLLAQTLISIGRESGKKVTAVLSSMDQVLGNEVGNANEIREAMEVMSGKGPLDVRRLTMALGAEMLMLAHKAPDQKTGEELVGKSLDDGTALKRFQELVQAQGGDPRVVEDPSLLPRAAHRVEVPSSSKGLLASMDSRKIGVAAMLAGAGRQKAEDRVDPAVGITVLKKVGDSVEKGEPLAVLQHNGASGTSEALQLILQAFVVAPDPPDPSPLILDVLRG